MKIRIGTRKSKLAMIQTELVRDLIQEKFPRIEIELVPMSTKGDQMLDCSLTSFGGKGVFTKELEDALLAGTVDLAVHSAKDMPMEFPEGLGLGAVLEREHPGDVLVTVGNIPAKDLPPGSVIGTSSLRREIQIKAINPQVRVRLLRGNVQTRIQKLRDGEYDGILLAAAGLRRLSLNAPEGLHLEYLDTETFVPAAGQGILAVEIRTGELSEVMHAIHSEEAAMMLRGEREFLTLLGGGCNAPCGAYCRTEGDKLVMNAMYAVDGKNPVYHRNSIVRTEGENCAVQLANKLAMQVRCQTVSLVGAGPGDAGLFTGKGLDCVRRADVIVYDNLISGSILNEARLDAELIYAGKRSNYHHLKQEEINELLVEQALHGKYVVRLKGGDPFIFGRGGEEAMALKAREIPFEMVPGVSSSYSVPAYGGIPVTERGLASSFHVITGHEGVHKTSEVLDYETLAKEEGTLIFLMGLKNLGRIVEQLIGHGKTKDTPVAVIQQGTTARQKKAVSTLEHIEEEVRRCGIQTPAITIVGDVVSLESELDWFLRGPLGGVQVLATGTRHMVRELEAALKPLGAEMVAISLIETLPLLTDEVHQAFDRISDYQWVVFTSNNGVDMFFHTMRTLEVDMRRLLNVKFAVVGKKTGAALAAHGFTYDFAPSGFTGEQLVEEWIPTLPKRDRVLLMRAQGGLPVIPNGLRGAGISYQDIVLYETWVDRRREQELHRAMEQADYITFASGSAATAFHEMTKEISCNRKTVSIGPSTTRVAKELGIQIYIEAAEYTAEGMAAAILADVRKKR